MKKLILFSRSRRGLMWVTLLVMLAFTGTASAVEVTIPLSDFLIFSGGGTTGSDAGFETQIAGASLYMGNIGSNYDLTLGASETRILGSVYAGRKVDLAPRTAIGSDGNPSHFSLEPPLGSIPTYPTYPLQLEAVVANGEATLRDQTKIFGTLDANSLSTSGTPTVSGTQTIGAGADTFALITMPTATNLTSFINTGNVAPVNNNPGTVLTLMPNTLATGYGTLSTAQNQIVNLQSGDYYFASINTGSELKLKIDLTSGNPINIYVVDAATFGQNTVLMVKGAGTSQIPGNVDGYVTIDKASQLAGLINWETGGKFTLGGGTGNPGGWGSIFGGTVYSTLASGVGVDVSQHIDWYGALYAYDTITLLDHSRYTFVPEQTNDVPEPATLLLLGFGLMGLAGIMRMSS